jgi:hypothetical protein
MNFHKVINSIELLGLLQQILTLDLRLWVKVIVICPVKSLFSSLKLWKLLTMNSDDLVSKLLGHIVDHFFDSLFFKSSPVERYSIVSLVRQSIDAVLPVLNPCLSIWMVALVGLTLLQFVD